MSEQRVVIRPTRSGHPVDVSRENALVEISIGREDDQQRAVIFDCSDPQQARKAHDLINALSRLVAEAKAGLPVSAG